jgi:hypothetical protein
MRKYWFKRIATKKSHSNFGIFCNEALVEDGWRSSEEAQKRVDHLQSLSDNAGPTWPFDNTKLNL